MIQRRSLSTQTYTIRKTQQNAIQNKHLKNIKCSLKMTMKTTITEINLNLATMDRMYIHDRVSYKAT